MARSDWQYAGNDDDLAAIGVPKHRGRALRVLFGLLLIGAAGFVLAYYLPLYRAHAALGAEFQRVAHEHAQTRADLKLTLAALDRVTKERDTLVTAAASAQSQAQTAAQRLEQVQRDIEPKLKGEEKDKSVELDRDAKALRVRLNAKRFFSPDLAALSPAGGKVVCTALAPLKLAPNVAVEVQSSAVPAWRTAATRASDAAEWIANTCALSPTAVRVVASTPSVANAPLLELSIQPR